MPVACLGILGLPVDSLGCKPLVGHLKLETSDSCCQVQSVIHTGMSRNLCSMVIRVLTFMGRVAFRCLVRRAQQMLAVEIDRSSLYVLFNKSLGLSHVLWPEVHRA